MSIVMLGLSECLLLAGLILVIAYARGLPPRWGGLAAAVLVSGALAVELCGIASIVGEGEAAAAAAAALNGQHHTGRIGSNGAAVLPSQTNVSDNSGFPSQNRGKSK